MTDRSIAISLIVDADPVFAYTALQLVYSLSRHLPHAGIHVQCTAEVPSRTRAALERLICTIHDLPRFGDGLYCNKLGQWENLRETEADLFIFLDTDMICVDDFTKYLSCDAIVGKVVDLDNPKLPLLNTLFEKSGFTDRPDVIDADGRGQTYRANCNGGFYSVPRQFAERLFEAWRRRALALLADIQPLKAAKKESHVDQIAFCMAIHETGLPFADLPANANYPLHLSVPMRLRTPDPLALLHYHNSSLNVLGLIELERELDAGEWEAVEAANAQMRANFDAETFWDFRYKHFPERGSGVGSRGANLAYKRDLLKAVGADSAVSILDVGCGDLEVVQALDLKNYIGLDLSAESLALAAKRRPEWTFVEAPAEVPSADMVLCFEVAIHQKTAADYRALIAFLASKTEKTLVVSGYDAPTDKIAANHMLEYYEPLKTSLEETGRFAFVEKIGAHSDVSIYRCDVC